MSRRRTPIKKTLEMHQGTTFLAVISCKQLDGTSIYDLTGATARWTLQAEEGDSTYLAEGTENNGRVVIDTVAGTITLVMLDSDVDALAFGGRRQRWWHKVELAETGGVVRPIQYGDVKAFPA